MNENQGVQTGNAAKDAADRGWFVGSFIEEKFGLRHTNDLEIRWAAHEAGEERPEWATEETKTTVCVLISGEMEFSFRDLDGERNVTLDKQGDFVIWGPGTDHKWKATSEAITIAVRWPG